MNTQELSDKVYRKIESYNQYGLPAYIYKNIVGTTMDTIAETLVKGENITIRGLMSMQVLWKHAHVGYNAVKKRKEKFPGKVRVRCKVSKNVLDALNADRNN